MQNIIACVSCVASTYIKQFISGYDWIHVIFDGVKTQKTDSNTDKQKNYSWILDKYREVTSIICCTELTCIINCQQLLWKKTAVDWITTSASNR